MARCLRLQFLTLTVLEIVRLIGGQCPLHFTTIFSVCVNISAALRTYCDAQAYCHGIGGEIITGSSYMKFDGKSFSGQPKRYWIGLTDLKHERQSSQSGWAWTDGSLTPPSEGINWGRDKPKQADKDHLHVLIKNQKIYNSHHSSEKSALCQPRSQSPSASFFEMEVIPVGLSSVEFAEGGGCAQPARLAESAIDCAAMCKAETKGWCVAVYFHEQRRECVSVLYTDATVRLSPDDGGWRKLVLMP